MLRHGEGVFLDDVTLEEASAALGVPVVPIGSSGEDLLNAHAGHLTLHSSLFTIHSGGSTAMSRPLVAIVGRPNVGKSMLFNRLAGRRLSIVEDTPGVTRDRLYAECEWNGRKFDIVDTGGIEPSADSEILLFMREQALLAIDAADVIVLVTEIGTGVTAADKTVADMLKRSGKPVNSLSTRWTPRRRGPGLL